MCTPLLLGIPACLYKYEIFPILCKSRASTDKFGGERGGGGGGGG